MHGEGQSKIDFAWDVEEQLGVDCIIPEYNQCMRSGKNEVECIRTVEKSATAETELSLEHIQDILSELGDMKKCSSIFLGRVEGHLSSDSVSIKDYTLIRNILLNLKNGHYELSMLSGK